MNWSSRVAQAPGREYAGTQNKTAGSVATSGGSTSLRDTMSGPSVHVTREHNGSGPLSLRFGRPTGAWPPRTSNCLALHWNRR